VNANESVHTLSGAYVVDAVDDAERAAFEAHLPGCRDCRDEVASLREAAALMADDSALTPPASLRRSVLAGISTIRPLPPEIDPAETSQPHEEEPASATVVPLRRHRFRMASLAAAAAVAASVAVGVTWQPWNDQGTSAVSAADQVLAAGDAQKVALDFKDGSTAAVYRSKSKGRAVILTDGMAPPPSGKVYEIWLRDANDHLVPAGLMPKQADNKVLLKGDAAKATGVGITIEPEGGSQQPTSEPIAMFELGKAEA
jgi:anti-sigma-K factor RskA